MEIINRFDGEYAYLSNFAHRPIVIKGENLLGKILMQVREELKE